MLQPHSELVTREVIGHSEAKGLWYIQIPSRWNKLVQEFHDIFDPPGMPVDRDTVHHIELLPNVERHYKCKGIVSMTPKNSQNWSLKLVLILKERFYSFTMVFTVCQSDIWAQSYDHLKLG